MARSESQKTRSSRVKALPWAMLLRAGIVVGRHVSELSAKDRARLRKLLRESGGRPGRLGARERLELRRLIGKLDLRGAGRELAPLIGGGRRGKRRRRG